MARISDSNNLDLSGYEPSSSGGGGITVAAPPPEQAPSPLMVSSMPAIAAGQDQLVRQFYGRNRVPMMRIFVVTQ